MQCIEWKLVLGFINNAHVMKCYLFVCSKTKSRSEFASVKDQKLN